MSNIVEVVRDDLQTINVSPHILEKVPGYIRRAVVALHKDGALPPRIDEFKAIDRKEEKRDGNGNLVHNFIFLEDDFLRLDKFTVYQTDGGNRSERPYQLVSTDLLFSNRRASDERNFFALGDYHLEEERTRKILILDPFPEDGEYIEIRYFVDGTNTPLENFNERYWEPIITKVRQILGVVDRMEAEEEIAKESANWRNQQGKDSYNKTHARTKVVNGLFGRTR